MGQRSILFVGRGEFKSALKVIGGNKRVLLCLVNHPASFQDFGSGLATTARKRLTSLLLMQASRRKYVKNERNDGRRNRRSPDSGNRLWHSRPAHRPYGEHTGRGSKNI